ncbi:hypothetical protein [Nonomuraea typhae]|uniref:hypothetical protein n=1 Tax=Nonomuraea typhae TaxID=2603600 RepID=UPI001CA5A064|nr:hypothetical protein [Nonomuraea typhae]
MLLSEAEWAHGAEPSLADQVRTVADGEEIFPGVRVRLAAGHTAGHAAYVLSSGGQRLIAFGDALHSPVQVAHPELSSVAGHDPAEAALARRRLVGELSAPDTIGFGIHFGDAQFGRVRDNAWNLLHPDGVGQV